MVGKSYIVGDSVVSQDEVLPRSLRKVAHTRFGAWSERGRDGVPRRWRTELGNNGGEKEMKWGKK
jgi:hypothetical protein